MRQVVLTLASPDRMFIGAQGNPIAEKRFGQATIRVVYVDRIDPNVRYRHVVTVMWK